MNEKLTELLVQLADKLGTTSENIWTFIHRQVLIESYFNLFLYSLSPLVVYLCFYVFGRLEKWVKGPDYLNEEGLLFAIRFFAYIVIFLAFMFYFVYVLHTLGDTMSGIFNTDYVTFQKIYKMVHDLYGR